MRFLTLMLVFAVGLAGPAAAKTWTAASKAGLVTALSSAVGGDTIEVSPGNYGVIALVMGNGNRVAVGGVVKRNILTALTAPVTVKSANPADPAVVNGIETQNAPFWRWEGLRVKQNGGNKSITIRLQSPDNALVNNIMGLGDCTSWDAATWAASASRMVWSSGPRTLVEGNQMNCVSEGIILSHGADDSIARNNTIRNISGDGIDVSALRVSLLGNYLANFWKIGGNHDDCVQIWTGPGVNQLGVNSGAHIAGNRCFIHEDIASYEANPTAWSVLPLSDGLQGFSAFDGSVQNARIEDNWYIGSSYNGISIAGATNVVFKGNRILALPAAGKNTNIRMGFARVKANPNWSPSGNTMADNISNIVDDTKPGAVYTNNRSIAPQASVYDAAFTDWRKGDLSLKGSSPPPVVTPPTEPPIVAPPDKPTEPPVVEEPKKEEPKGEDPKEEEEEPPARDKAALVQAIKDLVDQLADEGPPSAQ